MIRSEAFDAFARNWDAALEAAILAAAYAYQRPVKERLMEGYTTGDFSQGGAGVAGTVTVGAVTKDAGGSGVAVGTNVPYAAYWEFGHMNVFTRRYERVEVWREQLEAHGEDMERAFGAAFVRVIKGGAAPPTVQFYAGESPYPEPSPASGFGGYRTGTGRQREP